ncbi:MAG: arsenite methyltransferase [Actinomycetota bacterium]|jgi:SAM-dependent methyltransferase
MTESHTTESHKTETNHDDIRSTVRKTYTVIAEASGSCCGADNSCSDTPTLTKVDATELGYSAADRDSVPEGADLGLGCGNPGAIARMKPGETVLDLGSGAGFDAFLSARAVGETGKVIGVDMTPEMISKARANAENGGYTNVEFRLGEIEHLPVADASIDVIISNCVINLSPDKQAVFHEAMRVLRPGGRIAISDVVASSELPEEIRNDLSLYSCCISGASSITDVEMYLRIAGFDNVSIQPRDESKSFIDKWALGKNVTDYVLSASIEATKPLAQKSCC